MASKPLYAKTAIMAGLLACAISAQAASPAPQTLVLTTAPVDLTHVAKPGRGHAPVNVHRHFADASLLGQVKANLATARNEASVNGAHRRPKPTPTPAPTPTLTPTPTPTT